MRRLWVAAFALALGGCTVSSGEKAAGFLKPDIAAAYVPLDKSSYLVFHAHAAGIVIGPGIAVTNAHNFNLIPADSVIGRSSDYDLLFFHRPGGMALPAGMPHVGEKVVAYGQGTDGELRMAEGVVRLLKTTAQPICRTCKVQSAFTFEAKAGKGFSGGPVVDADDGRLVGIVFGYVDAGETRTMYAYDMRRVGAELATLEGRLPVDVD
jgi:hypothetical protein